jgi:HTH-type transcriptional regulator/antitoxin HigA
MAKTSQMPAVIKALRSPEDYARAQQRAAELLVMNPPKSSPEGEEFEVLGILIDAYDRDHYPLGPADPIAAIEFAIDQRNLQPKDLVPFLGTRSRVTEVLKGQRSLTLEQIRRLHHGLGIPFECLISAGKKIEESKASYQAKPRRRRRPHSSGKRSA